MDYVLYTPKAYYWDSKKDCWMCGVEFVYYKDADKTTVIDEIFSPSDCIQGLCFWLGAVADS